MAEGGLTARRLAVASPKPPLNPPTTNPCQVTADEAEARIKAANEPYKLEILQSIRERDPSAAITIYHIGETTHPAHWWDLCAGPHVPSTGAINAAAVELESVAGAYWRGDEARAMLQRVYGTAWSQPVQLEAYKHLKAEAARRDHRKLGAELNLFSIQESAGGGLVFWHPPGAMVRHTIETFWKDLHLARGYDLVYSPHIAKVDLWKTSGHFDFYKENMYDQMTVEDEEYQLKPMNCPFHIAVYKAGYYSYRDLPLRWAELGTVYRWVGAGGVKGVGGDMVAVQLVTVPPAFKPLDCSPHTPHNTHAPHRACRYERSGTMHGLFRVRGFTQDDAHIFCLPSQITDEIKGVLDLTEEMLSTFGFTQYEVRPGWGGGWGVGARCTGRVTLCLNAATTKASPPLHPNQINLSTRPEKSVGDDEIWAKSEAALKEALALKGWDYVVDEGGGAFYGPKIDLKIQDAIGRKWQCSTIQLDFNLPTRFDMAYVESDASRQRPIMIHRAIFGSLERFFGILVENYAGAFPLWLAPVQVRLLPVNEAVLPYVEEAARELRAAGVRVEVMERQSLGKMIRLAQTAKTPVACVVGSKEAEDRALSVRLYGGQDLGSLALDEVVARARAAIASRGEF